MTIDTGAIRVLPKVIPLKEKVQAKSRRKALRVKPGRLFLTLFALWAIATFGVQQVSIWQETHELKDVQRQVTQANDSNKLLQTEVSRMQSSEYIEQVARERLGMTRPGEILYVPSTTYQPVGSTAPGSSSPPSPGH